MNNQRRAKLRKAVKKIGKIKDMISEVSDFIDEVRMEEEDMFDSLPDWKQTTDHGIASQDAAQEMFDAITELEYADTSLEEAIGSLEEASNAE